MNIAKCINGHFFDEDKFKFCPHCGVAVHRDNKLNEKPNRPDMVMGMMKPPEPVIRGNMRCADEFISEDPIELTNSNECIHDFIVVEAVTGGRVYPDKKKGFFKKIFNKKEDGWDSIHRMASKELKKLGNKKCIFKCDCMVDITNFDAKDPTDSLGYACSANILVFSDGKISVIGDQEAERFHISSVLSYNDNIGNYNPSHEHEVKFILADRAIVIGFYDKDKSAKKELTDKLKQVASKMKQQNV